MQWYFRDMLWKYICNREWRSWTLYLGDSESIYSPCTLNLLIFTKGFESFFLSNILVGKESLTSTLILIEMYSYIALMLIGISCAYKRLSYIISYTTLMLMVRTLIISINVDWHIFISYENFTQLGSREMIILESHHSMLTVDKDSLMTQHEVKRSH
jgi:hypothetical protein